MNVMCTCVPIFFMPALLSSILPILLAIMYTRLLYMHLPTLLLLCAKRGKFEGMDQCTRQCDTGTVEMQQQHVQYKIVVLIPIV